MPATSAKKKVISPEIVTKRDLKEKTKEVILSSNLAPRRDAPKCYNCQGTGHLARECPSERQERQDRPQRNYNQRSYGPKCYNCQQTGHTFLFSLSFQHPFCFFIIQGLIIREAN